MFSPTFRPFIFSSLYSFFGVTNRIYSSTPPSSPPQISTNSDKSHSSSQDIKSWVKFCFNSCRNRDREHYFASLVAPIGMKHFYWAVRAFHIETSSVLSNTTNAQFGTVRLEWWKQAMSNTFSDSPPPMPICQLIHALWPKYPLVNASDFFPIIDHRIQDLDHVQPRDINQLSKHMAGIHGSLLSILLKAHNVVDDVSLEAANHIGTSLGLVNLIRGTRELAKKGIMYIPVDICDQTELDIDSVFALEDSIQLRTALFKMSDYANAHLELGRRLYDKINPEARPLLVSSIIAQNALETLQSVDFDMHHPRLQRFSPMLPIKLFVNRVLDRY